MSDPDLVAEEAVGAGRAAIWLRVRRQGRDLQLSIGGGEAHVGAVALYVPPRFPGNEAFQALAVVPPHKEGPLAEEAARRLAVAAQCTCVAIVGIHQDDATGEEIAAIVANVHSGLGKLETRLAAARRNGGCDDYQNPSPKGAP